MRARYLIPCLALLGSVLPGCYPRTDTEGVESVRRPVDVIEVRREPIVRTLQLIGTTEPWREATLRFEVSGVIEKVFVEEGDLVESETSIARLALDDYYLAVAQAKARQEAAQAALDLLRAGTRKEDLEAARADNDHASARANYWSGEWLRVKKLFQTKAVSASELEQVQREHEAAEQLSRAAKARLARAIAGPRKEDIEAAAAEVRARGEAFALSQRQLRKATLLAPFRGRIETRLVDAGTYINVFPAGSPPIVRLVDLDQVDAVVAVAEVHRNELSKKSTVEVISAVDPAIRSSGQIVSLAEVADTNTGTYALRVRVPNMDRRFTGGMVVLAEVNLGTTRQTIRIPLSAVCRGYGREPYVLLADTKTGLAVAKDVQLGPIAGDRIEISAGLAEGDLLVVRGQDRIVAGDQIKHRQVTLEIDPKSP